MLHNDPVLNHRVRNLVSETSARRSPFAVKRGCLNLSGSMSSLDLNWLLGILFSFNRSIVLHLDFLAILEIYTGFSPILVVRSIYLD